MKLNFSIFKKGFYYEDTLFIATSEEVQKIISSAFRVPISRIKITGYPRNDSFFIASDKNIPLVRELIKLKAQNKKLIIYLPTHRKKGEKR